MSVTAWLEDRKELGPDDLKMLAELAGSIPSVDGVKYYEKLIKKQTKKRQVEKVALKLQSKLVDLDDEQEIDNLITSSSKYMVGLVGTESEGFTHIRDVLKEVVDDADENRPDIIGTPTGFTELDRMLSGVKGGELIIIGARPSMGKTAFALELASNCGKPRRAGEIGALVPVYSLEMSNKSLGQRFLSSAAHVNSRNIKIGNSSLSQEEWKRVYLGAGELSVKDILLNDKSGIDIFQIKNDLIRLRKENPDREIICFIDYLQLIKGDPIHKGNRTQELSDITRTLKLLTKDYNICIVALSQLSRGLEQRQDKRPMMSDIRESGSVEQDADVVAFLYRDDYYDKESESKNLIEVIIAKQRDGSVGTVSLAMIKEYGKFINLERRFDE
jgi:replicative DNA helicase